MIRHCWHVNGALKGALTEEESDGDVVCNDVLPVIVGITLDS